MLRRVSFPVVLVCTMWASLPFFVDIPLSVTDRWSSVLIPIVLSLSVLPILYFLKVPQSITISHDKILLKYRWRIFQIKKNAIRKSTLIKPGRHPSVIKISTTERNSHLINLVAFSEPDRELVIKAILGESSPTQSKKPSLDEVLDYIDWLPERLLGSRFFTRFWNWGTKISLLVPLQTRSSSKRDNFILWKRINTTCMLVVLLLFSGIMFLLSAIISLGSLLSEEPVTPAKILGILIINLLVSYLLLFLFVGTYSRIKLLKRIKEDRA